jgi:hypothetical protein
MPELGELTKGDEDAREEWTDEAVAVADAVAALAIEGHIPPENLPTLHFVLGDEVAALVAEFMDGGRNE